MSDRVHFLQANGVRLAVREWGRRGAQPAVCVPGSALPAELFCGVEPLLAEKFHGFSLDRRGHGQSEKPDEGYDFTHFRDDLIASMAVTEDLYFLRGSGGGNAPKGIRYWANSANVAGSAGTTSANMETDFKNLIQALEGNNVRMLKPVWIMSPRTKNALWVARDANGNLVFPEVRDGKLWSYPVFVTNQVPTNLGSGSDSELYFADMSDVVIAENEQIMIDGSDTAAYHDGSNVVAAFSQDQTVIRAIARHDLVVRHDYSVAVRTGVAY